ncbi:MAG: hypothetical protein LQ349_007338 [Xanthoria aureola]|nr:MAG: hypothetical protein LQ349_007338 [Xanthoria aureola]
MVGVQSVTSTVKFESPEDPMEVFPGVEDDPADEDGIDIDLDLTIDHNENLYDDGMIEGSDAEAEDSSHDAGLVHDEEMMDDEEQDNVSAHKTAEDFCPKNYQGSNDFENPEIKDQFDVVVESAAGPAQVSEIDLHLSPSESKFKGQDHQVEHSRCNRSNLPDDSPHSTQPDADENPVRSAQDILTASQVVSSDRPVEHVQDPDITLNHSDHRTHDTRTLSEGVISGLQNPLTSAGEHKTTPGSTLSGTFVPVAELEGVEHHAGTTARTTVEHARHDSKSLSNGSSFQDDSSTMSVTKGEITSKTYSTARDHSALPRTNVPPVRENHPNERTASEANPFQEKQTVRQIPRVHPVTVKYQDREMYLFPPTEEQKDHDKYFLPDESLAAEGIQSLFQGFRDYLGESISDMEELEIKFDDLDLWISESNIDTANITLVHILDIYCQLHCNESDDPPESMHLTLLTNARFADKLKNLADLATQCVGLSQLAYAYEEDLSADDDSLDDPPALDGIRALETPTGSTNSAGADVSPLETNSVQPEQPVKHKLTELLATESTNTKDLLNNNGIEELVENEPRLSEHTALGNSTDPEEPVIDTAATLNKTFTSNPPILQAFDFVFSTDTSVPQMSDAANEDFRGDEYYEDEERFDVEENSYPNEEQSIGSSTVQGDDTHILQDDTELSNDVSLRDHPLASTQQQPPSGPKYNVEAEDVISYETDEEDAEDVEDAEKDFQWQGDGGADLASSEFKELKPAALHDTNDTSSHASINANDDASQPLNNLDDGAQGNNTDCAELRKDKDNQIHEHDNDEQATRKTDAIVGESLNSSLDEAPLGLAAQMSVHPAEEEEDEITFDEEGDEEAEDLSGAFTDPALQHPARSGPTALKRGRGIDEATDIDHSQGFVPNESAEHAQGFDMPNHLTPDLPMIEIVASQQNSRIFIATNRNQPSQSERLDD